jgi:hypothetical protein
MGQYSFAEKKCATELSCIVPWPLASGKSRLDFAFGLFQ